MAYTVASGARSARKLKTVGGKNSGVVQGADAANVDAQNAQDDAQEPETTEPDP